jgi:SAM-dependent methyltransferase
MVEIQQTTTASGGPAPGTAPPVDPAVVEACAGRMLNAYSGAMVSLVVDVADRAGLLEAMTAGPGTSAELAQRAGLVERYVREVLGALVTGRLVDFDPETARYTLPAEHALCLTGSGSMNLTPMSRVVTELAGHVTGVARACRDGGGVPYEAYRPELVHATDRANRGLFDDMLLEVMLPLTGDLQRRLDDGIAVADIGCGTGHSTNLMAQAHPRSTFVGYDLAPEAIDLAQREAGALGLRNVDFAVRDVTRLPEDSRFGAVFAFDAVHDQRDPAGVLAEVHRSLEPGGVFVMTDINLSSRLEDNVGNPLAPLIYGFSTLHCMTVSLAEGGTGLGAAWGRQLAQRMLEDAGFVDVTAHDVPDDPMDVLYTATRAA